MSLLLSYHPLLFLPLDRRLLCFPSFATTTENCVLRFLSARSDRTCNVQMDISLVTPVVVVCLFCVNVLSYLSIVTLAEKKNEQLHGAKQSQRRCDEEIGRIIVEKCGEVREEGRLDRLSLFVVGVGNGVGTKEGTIFYSYHTFCLFMYIARKKIIGVITATIHYSLPLWIAQRTRFRVGIVYIRLPIRNRSSLGK